MTTLAVIMSFQLTVNGRANLAENTKVQNIMYEHLQKY